MNILHYTLGLPPLRSGGLTQYSVSLMMAQTQCCNVTLLYPGGLDFLIRKKIKRNKAYNGIQVYTIKNAVNITLLHGVKNPNLLIGESNRLSKNNLENFYQKVNPDIFHIHTLMGLPYELVHFLKEKGTKIIYTSHDYYGLCLRVNFIDFENNVCTEPFAEKCAICNQNAPSNAFLRLRNLRILLRIKNRLPIKTISRGLESTQIQNVQKKKNIEKVQEYQLLLDFYIKIFLLIDCFHFNSVLTQNIYSKYINTVHSSVIPISHKNIKDNRNFKNFDTEYVRLAFIGNTSIYKGFPLLKNVLLDLLQENIENWTLQVWGAKKEIDKHSERIIHKGKYSFSELERIFEEIDLLIVPSIWNETFSLVTLEALSCGVPVLVSSTVGAKDIVKGYNPNFIYMDEIGLYDILKKILRDKNQLIDYNKKIVNSTWIHSFSEHTRRISKLYSDLLK